MSQRATCDIVVIGGGMAGVSAARELAADARVVLIEAEETLAKHTTGRSAATVVRGIGNAVVRGMTEESLPLFELLRHELGTTELLRPRDGIYLAEVDHGGDLDHVLGLPGVTEITVAEAVESFPALRPEVLARAARGTGNREIDVMALHAGYVRGLVARGGEVRRSAPVTGLTRRVGGWDVLTPSGTLSCAVVVNAAGAWGDVVAGLAGVEPLGLMPMRRTAFTAAVPDIPDFGRWPLIGDAAERWYAKPEGNQLLGSPAEEKPAPPGDPRVDEVDVAEALEHLRRVTTFPLRSVSAQWVGLRTFTPDRTPRIGESSPGSGFWWCVGQGGYGIQTAPAVATRLARLMAS